MTTKSLKSAQNPVSNNKINTKRADFVTKKPKNTGLAIKL